MGKNTKGPKSSTSLKVLAESQRRALDILTTEARWTGGDEESALRDCLSELDRIDKSIAKLRREDEEYAMFWETPSKETELERLIVLHDFLKAHCPEGACDGFEFKHASDGKGRGVYATRGFERHEIAFQIPASVMLSAKHGSALENEGCWDPYIDSVLKQLADNEAVELAMVLLHHASCRDRSIFWPYINSLPRVYDIPPFWPVEMFTHIRDPKTALKARLNVRATAMLYFRCCHTLKGMATAASSASPLLKDGLGMTWKAFRWAMGSVITRQNRIPIGPDGQRQALTLVPGWDMMNHSAGEMTTDFDSSSSSITFKTVGNLTTGDEILMCYGSRSNEELLIYSGFTPVTDNVYDTLAVDISLGSDASSVKMAKMIYKAITGVMIPDGHSTLGVKLRRFGMNENITDGSPKGWDFSFLDADVLAALMAASVPKAEFTSILRAEDRSPAVLLDIISDDTKSSMKTALKLALETHLYPSSTRRLTVTERWAFTQTCIERLNEGHAKLAGYHIP